MVEDKIALITGVTGQDGSYLAEFLLKKGYEVHSVPSDHGTRIRLSNVPIRPQGGV